MRNFRRLPPLLRVARILGLLFSLASIVLLLGLVLTLLTFSFPPWPVDAFLVPLIALNLSLLGGACSSTVDTYRMRFRRSDQGPFPLDAWQSQLRTILLLAALLSGALAVVVRSSPYFAFVDGFVLATLAACVLLAASPYASIRWRARN